MIRRENAAYRGPLHRNRRIDLNLPRLALAPHIDDAVIPVRLPAALLAFGFAIAAAAPAATPPGWALNLGVYRPASSHVYAYSDLAARTLVWGAVFGMPGDAPVTGDFDGNGVADLAVYRAGTWHIDTTHDFSAATTMAFGGQAGDVPLAGDFDGDGKADLVIYRSGTWFIRRSSDGKTVQRTLGAAGDQPVVGDFDRDGLADAAVFRSGTWLIQTASTNGADVVDHFGGVDDKACAIDWDQDGRTDLCVYRNGIWLFQALGAGALLDSFTFGGAGDVPLAGGSFDYAHALYVRAGASGTMDGTPAHPFATIGKAFDAAGDGGVIRVAPGTYAENVVLYGPAVNYAPGKFGKNNVKLIGAGRRATSIVPANGDAIVLQGSTGNVVERFTIGSTTGRGVVLIGGAGSVSPSLPGSSLTIALNDIEETNSYGVLVTGASHAEIRSNRIARTKSMSGIGTQSGAPSATIEDNEITASAYPAGAPGGNGIEAQSSSQLTIARNDIHDNNRFGIIGIVDSHLDIHANTITANRLNGIILCGAAANDTSTAQVVGNWIAGNGTDLQNGQGYNGLEFYGSCLGSQTVSGNVFDGNSLNGVFVGSGSASISGNLFTRNRNGITVFASSSGSANTQATISGNTFADNLQDGVFVQRWPDSTRSVGASVGGKQGGQGNEFSGHGFHGIGCSGSPLSLTCPAGGNTFFDNNDDIESSCPATCAK
jgi:hypothetical protein